MQRYYSGLINKFKNISFRLALTLLIFILILSLFLYLTNNSVLRNRTELDDSVFAYLLDYTSPPVTELMIFITFFGSTHFLLPAYIVLILYYFLFKKDSRRSFNIVAVGLSSIILLLGVKEIFRRQRPVSPLIPEVGGYSFPSGHSSSAFTFAGILIYILWESTAPFWLKWAGTILLLAFASLVAFSRVYLHVHYASDVIAGFCLALLWLVVSFYILKRIHSRRLSAS